MRWPWRRTGRTQMIADAERGLDEARRRRAEAEELLRQTRARTPQARAVAEGMRQVRQVNHLRLIIEGALRGEPG